MTVHLYFDWFWLYVSFCQCKHEAIIEKSIASRGENDGGKCCELARTQAIQAFLITHRSFCSRNSCCENLTSWQSTSILIDSGCRYRFVNVNMVQRSRKASRAGPVDSNRRPDVSSNLPFTKTGPFAETGPFWLPFRHIGEPVRHNWRNGLQMCRNGKNVSK